MKISGKFEVTVKPMDPYAKGSEGNSLGRMSINKVFYGDLSGESRGEMLSAMTPVKGSAGYVAIEQVAGTLGGKRGTFVLQHFGIMKKGEDFLILEVVPDSGTGELVGISGKMSIQMDGGVHYYDLEYQLD
ncbi:DUF3224 domain-containing protein [Microbulbifer sp. TRSA007]|uniref:DUF3224 domain-containing protein n=1 Tax=unclassified Microbulbifer TaxID=2619833 RepID=UPI00403989F9